MKMPIFKLSLISLALFGGAAHAANDANATQNAQELQTIRVKGDTSTRRVTVRQMDETTATQLKEVLAAEPSFAMGGGNGTSQFLYLRGMGQNSVDIKVDNAYTDGQLFYHQSRHMLDPALVKIVAVQKGAGSASAGIGQTNGAIVAKTLDAADLLKNSSNPNFGVKLNAGYNSNDGYNYGAAVFGKAGVFDYLLVGNHLRQDSYRAGSGYINTNTKINRVDYSDLKHNSFLAKAGVTLDNHRFVLSHMHDRMKGTRTVREEMQNFSNQNPSVRTLMVDNTNFEWTAKDLGFAQSATANIYRLVHTRKADDDGQFVYMRFPGATTYKLITTGANINFDSNITDNILLKYGLNYRHQKAQPDRIVDARYRNQTKRDAGIYVEAIANLGDKVTLTGGLRYDHFTFNAMDGQKRSDGAINPSMAITFQATPELSFRAHHNYATRSPRMQDVVLSTGSRKVTISDDAKAERARNTEIGFNFNRGGFGLDGSYFWQTISDALGTTTGRDNNSLQAQVIINAGKIKNRGYEFGISYRWNGLTARLGVAHAKPRFYGDGLSTNPEYATAIGRTWIASLAYRFENPNLELSIQHRQVEGVKKEDSWTLSNSRGLQSGNRGGLQAKPGYGVTDIAVNWKPLNNDKMNVNFAVDNVFNKFYYPHGQRGVGGAAFPGEGRSFRVGMNYTF